MNYLGITPQFTLSVHGCTRAIYSAKWRVLPASYVKECVGAFPKGAKEI